MPSSIGLSARRTVARVAATAASRPNGRHPTSRLLRSRQKHRGIFSAATTVTTVTATTPSRIPRLCSCSRQSTSSFKAEAINRSLPRDVGGDTSRYGPIPLENPDDLLDWERRCHSLFAVLASKGELTTDGLRRSIEALSPDQYDEWTYYEKWAAGMTSLLLERGTIRWDDLNEALFGKAHLSSGGAAPMYRAGDCVRVRPFRRGSGIEWRRPHVRTPGYIYGVAGTIERVCGRHGDPSLLAFGLDPPEVQLYRVRFRMDDVWPERRRSIPNENTDDGGDALEVEIYEPWLEPANESFRHACSNGLLFDHSHGSDCKDSDGLADTGSGHDHHHDHLHVHASRSSIEERAAGLEGPPRPGKELHEALTLILQRNGVVTATEIRAMAERLDMAGRRLDGAALVARSWVDPSFEERLLEDPSSAAAELGIETSNPNAPTILTVLKNTPAVHNLVVCTLCSCYPSGMLGIAPSWYKSREYRSRAVREPRQVLLEFGTQIPDSKKICVHDSTADHRYIVLPERPQGTEGWSESDLRKLVSRDSMVGVSVPSLGQLGETNS